MLTEKIKRILVAPDASFWLKKAILENLDRDPVDARNDAEALYYILKDRCNRILAMGAA